MTKVQIQIPPSIDINGSIVVVLVGGFLGAGKTAAISALAKSLAAKGKRVGLIANDQAPGLVDTERLSLSGSPVAEVAGGCFCCQFDLFASRFGELASNDLDVILCEPVGSCTDMVATVIRPLRYYYGKQMHVTPFVVLVDPSRLKAFLEATSPFPSGVNYIYEKQLLEADQIAVTKSDLIERSEISGLIEEARKRYGKPVWSLSSVDGTGIDRWCSSILGEESAGDNALSEIDYDLYANGEAELGWLNASFQIDGKTDGRPFVASVLEAFKARCIKEEAEIAHIKIEVASGGMFVFGNLTSNVEAPAVSGGGTLSSPVLKLNARVRIDPERLGAMAVNCLNDCAEELGLKARVSLIQSFKPGYPRPPYRMAGEAK